MSESRRILVADDHPDNVAILVARLTASEFTVITAGDGKEALERAYAERPDLILLDVEMPEMDGLEVCRRLRGDSGFPFTPIIMVTARTATQDVVNGLKSGADEYLTKPIDQAALVARVQSMLRIKELHDTVNRQAVQLKDQAFQLQEWNRVLEARVAEQVEQLERVGRLKRFFSPQLAARLVSSGDESILDSHRREISVVFCDLRGFTHFCMSAAPEVVIQTIREYHGTLGPLVIQFEGTLEQFAGDGFMVFFNDPEPIPDHVNRAVKMSLEMRAEMDSLCATWRARGHQLGFGVGVASGEATMGMIGFEGRIDYAAIGPVSNLASRLSDRANAGEILISQSIVDSLGPRITVEPVGEQEIKGFDHPVPVYRLVSMDA